VGIGRVSGGFLRRVVTQGEEGGKNGREEQQQQQPRHPLASFLPLLSLLPHRRRRLFALRALASHPWVAAAYLPTCVLPGELCTSPVASPLGMDAGGEKFSDAAAAEGGEGGGDLYAVLGLKKECSDADLKVAYRKLAKVSERQQFGS